MGKDVTQLLALTEGREKVSKLVQYGAKMVAHLLATRLGGGSGAAVAWARALTQLDKDVGDVRTWLRMFKWYDELKKVVAAEPTADLRALAGLRALCMAGYLFLNNWFWLVKHGLLTGDAPALARRSFAFWSVAALAALLADLRRLQMRASSLRTVKTPEQRKVAVASIVALRRMLVRDLCNLHVATVLRQWNPIDNPAILGAAGALESVLAIRTMMSSGKLWWSLRRQDALFVLQEHKIGRPVWFGSQYRVLIKHTGHQIACADAIDEIEHDYEAIQMMKRRIQLEDHTAPAELAKIVLAFFQERWAAQDHAAFIEPRTPHSGRRERLSRSNSNSGSGAANAAGPNSGPVPDDVGQNVWRGHSGRVQAQPAATPAVGTSSSVSSSASSSSTSLAATLAAAAVVSVPLGEEMDAHWHADLLELERLRASHSGDGDADKLLYDGFRGSLQESLDALREFYRQSHPVAVPGSHGTAIETLCVMSRACLEAAGALLSKDIEAIQSGAVSAADWHAGCLAHVNPEADGEMSKSADRSPEELLHEAAAKLKIAAQNHSVLSVQFERPVVIKE